MASPAQITCANLAGKFTMNRSLTDDCDGFFALQGISWVLRKVMRVASPELTITHRVQNDTMHIDIVSVSPAATMQEHFALDWSEQKHSDKVWGKSLRKAKMVNLDNFQMEGKGSEEDKDFLAAKKLKDGKTNSGFLDDEHVQILSVSQNGHGTVEMVWGFEEIEGGRRYTRRVVARSGDKVERVRLVYDYLGPSN